MENKLAQYSTLGQKDKGPAFISLIPQILAQPAESLVKDLHTLVDTVVNQDSVRDQGNRSKGSRANRPYLGRD